MSLHGPWFSALACRPDEVGVDRHAQRLGLLRRLGRFRWFEDRLALALLLRYTHLNLNRQGEKIDADSFGVALGAAFGD